MLDIIEKYGIQSLDYLFKGFSVQIFFLDPEFDLI